MKYELFVFWGYLFLLCYCFFIKPQRATTNANIRAFWVLSDLFSKLVTKENIYITYLLFWKIMLPKSLVFKPYCWSKFVHSNEDFKWRGKTGKMTSIFKCWMSYFFRQRTLYVTRTGRRDLHVVSDWPNYGWVVLHCSSLRTENVI